MMKKEVTAGNEAAIDRALEQGHKDCRTTGRPLASGLDIPQRGSVSQRKAVM